LRGLPIGHFAALVLLSSVLIWAFLVRSPDESPHTETKSLSIPAPIPLGTNTGADQVAASDPATPQVSFPIPAQNDADLPAATATPQETAQQETVETTAKADNQQLPAPNTAPPGANLDTPKLDHPVLIDTSQTQTPIKEAEGEKAVSPNRNNTNAPSRMSDPLVASEQELLRLSASGFVLQIMATSTAEAVRAYVALQPNRKNLRTYRGNRNGKTLYIVVEGFYADKAAAQAAILNLPEQQRRAGPWPKTVEHIQQEIRANRP
jgi:DamX protein